MIEIGFKNNRTVAFFIYSFQELILAILCGKPHTLIEGFTKKGPNGPTHNTKFGDSGVRSESIQRARFIKIKHKKYICGLST